MLPRNPLYRSGFLLLLLLSACYYNKADFVVPDNQPPPDPTISAIVKENYVNKVYISVLGRKALTDEFDEGLAILDQDELSEADRSEFLDEVFSKPEYLERVYELARADLLNSLDTNLVVQYIQLFEFLKETSPDSVERELFDIEIQRLEALRSVLEELATGTIDVVGMHRICLDNFFYDDINMGTENFVVSVFQNLLLRFPTSAENISSNELESSKNMVDGFEAVLFFQIGSSKEDFMNIFLSSNDYFEGQVRLLYNRFLFREPESEEMTQLALQYSLDRDYEQLQKAILTTDEYVGIK